MKRFMGLMPSSEVAIEKRFLVDVNQIQVVTIQAGYGGWTIIFPDNSTEFKDEKNDPETNYQIAKKVMQKHYSKHLITELSADREEKIIVKQKNNTIKKNNNEQFPIKVELLDPTAIPIKSTDCMIYLEENEAGRLILHLNKCVYRINKKGEIIERIVPHENSLKSSYSSEEILEILENSEDLEEAKDKFRENWIE